VAAYSWNMAVGSGGIFLHNDSSNSSRLQAQHFTELDPRGKKKSQSAIYLDGFGVEIEPMDVTL